MVNDPDTVKSHFRDCGSIQMLNVNTTGIVKICIKLKGEVTFSPTVNPIVSEGRNNK